MSTLSQTSSGAFVRTDGSGRSFFDHLWGIRFPALGVIFAAVLIQLTSNAAMAQNAVALAAVSGSSSSQLPAGRFELFVAVTGNKGGVYHSWQLQDGSGWQPTWISYSPTPDNLRYGLVAGRDGIGRIICAWISKGNIYFAEAGHVDASLINSGAPPISPTKDSDGKTYKFTQLALVTNDDGTVEILALNSRGRVFSLKETAPADDGKPWTWQGSGARLLGGGDIQQISVTKHGKGLLALVGLGKDGKAYAKFQTIAGKWDPDPWTNLDGNKIKAVYAAQSTAGQLEVLALGADEAYYLQFQNKGSLTFSGWHILLKAKFAPNAYFGQFQDGSLFVASHIDPGATQFKGSFVKAFQGPNNGSWAGNYAFYETHSISPQGDSPQDSLDYLDPRVWTAVPDANHLIHYFSLVKGTSKIDHFADGDGASYDPNTHQINRMLGNFEGGTTTPVTGGIIPNLPW